jgi:hypothetical protein
MQKCASLGTVELQDGQRRSTRAPHPMQNRAPAGFSVPQAAQVTVRE